ncbi:MAG: hypothetical protein ACOC8N_02835 [Spirochaetota bacterium]
MKRFRMGFIGLAGAGLILAFVFFMVGCTTGTNLEGTWLATGLDMAEASPQQEAESRAAIAEFSGSSFEFIAYEDTMQVFGIKGTFSINEDNEILEVTVTHMWEVREDVPDWYEDPDLEDIPFSVSGDTLTMEIPEGPPEGVQFTKTSFTVRTELVDTWYDQDSGDTMDLQSDGTYTWEAYDQSESNTGTWDASAEYLRSVATSFEGQEGYYYGFLNPYEWEGTDTLWLTVDAGAEQEYRTTQPQ